MLEQLENDPNAERRLLRALDDLVDGDSFDDLNTVERRAIRDLVDELEVKEDELEEVLDEFDAQIDGLENDIEANPLTDSEGWVDTFEAMAAVSELGFPGSEEWVGKELADHWPPSAGNGQPFDPRSIEIASDLVAQNGETAETFFNGIGVPVARPSLHRWFSKVAFTNLVKGLLTLSLLLQLSRNELVISNSPVMN